ncbi:hypothetical protein [Streptomyces scabiei]|uniref:hypothetical protein n=1 Tax=Streptomyces scabiei TaxID=1930 RepID=UPI0029B14F29|nr:hypothetical protein [Streptomyces scabiei]MDX3204742.1 hypothetical protein [Streptomyces scabiei]
MQQYPYPDDLVQAQIACHRAYGALASAPRGSSTTQRRQLLHLSTRILFHPYWAGASGRAQMEGLRWYARALEQTRAA